MLYHLSYSREPFAHSREPARRIPRGHSPKDGKPG